MPTLLSNDALQVVGRPKLRNSVNVAFDAGMMTLSYGRSVLTFEGKAVAFFEKLIPLLDGRKMEQIVDVLQSQLGSDVSAAASQAVQMLLEKEVIDDADMPALPDAWDFYRATYPRNLTKDLRNRLGNLRVQFAGDGRVADALRAQFEQAGIVVGEPVTDRLEDSLLVFSGDSQDADALRSCNRAMIEKRRQWMQVLHFDGMTACVGPIFVPAETACYECFLARRLANQFKIDENRGSTSFPPLAGIDAMIAGMASVAAVLRLTHGDSRLIGRAAMFELFPEMQWTTSEVHRAPRCLACSRPGGSMPWYERYE